jgi:hypothetical protein
MAFKQIEAEDEAAAEQRQAGAGTTGGLGGF